MSADTVANPGSSSANQLVANDKDENNCSKVQGNNTGVPGDPVQDQVILSPEIMSMILGHMDSRSLKRARLVCKCWLLEAQVHIERKGLIVRLNGDEFSFPKRVKKFILAMQKKRPLDLIPRPFQSIEVDEGKDDWLSEELIVQLGSVLHPPIVITRFNPGILRTSLAIQIVNEYAASLEYLRISLHDREPYEAELVESLVNPDQSFPKLRHISLDTNKSHSGNPGINSFVSLIVGIVGASPNLNTYESTSENTELGDELSSKLLFKVDIRDVKTLLLYDYKLNAAALQHFIAYPFRGLENLRMTLFQAFHHNPPPNERALIATLAKSTATLRTLDLWWYRNPENIADFPVCPNVRELALGPFPYGNNFLSDRFPSLRVLTASWIEVDVLGEAWIGLFPLFGLKTLRLSSVQLKRHDEDLDEQLPLEFFEKFPALERLRLDYPFVMDCCRVKAGGHPIFSNILEGVRHLELCGNDEVGWFEEIDYYRGRSLFAVLSGIETLTLVKPNDNLLLIPFKDMPALKVLQFPWGAYLEMTKLLEISKGLEKVVITNCCSFPRIGDPWSSKALESFFDSAPNAECGCKDWANMSQ